MQVNFFKWVLIIITALVTATDILNKGNYDFFQLNIDAVSVFFCEQEKKTGHLSFLLWMFN